MENYKNIPPIMQYGTDGEKMDGLFNPVGQRVIKNFAAKHANSDYNQVFVTNTAGANLLKGAHQLQLRIVQQDQQIQALKEQLSKSQQPTREYGMQTGRRPLWSQKDQLLLNQLTDGQDNINWATVQQQFPERSVHQLKSHYKNQQRKDQLILQQQQIQALQQQIKPSEIQQRIQMLEAMLGSTLQGHTFKESAKHDAAEFAVRQGWIWSQSDHTYEKRLDQQTLASGADRLYRELYAENHAWFSN